MDRHQQVAVAVAVPPGRSTAVLPRQLEPLLPVHADFVQPGGLRGGEASLFLSGPDKALVFQPAAHGHAPKAVGARHVQRLSLCRHLLCGGIIALPVGVQRAAELPVSPAAGRERLFQREGFRPRRAALLPQLLHTGQRLKGRAQLCHRHTAAGCKGACQHLPVCSRSSAAAHQHHARDPGQRGLHRRAVGTDQQPEGGRFVGRKAFCILINMRSCTKQLLGLLCGLRRRCIILAEDEAAPGSIREPLRQQLFHRRKLLYGEAQSLIFLGVGVRAARQMEVFHLGTEAGHRIFQRPEQGRIGGRHGQQALGHRPAQRQRLHDGVGQHLLGSAAAVARGVRLPQSQQLCPRAKAKQGLDTVGPVLCAHLPPAVQHQQAGPELSQRHPAQRILHGQLLAAHQPHPAAQRPAQPLCQGAAQLQTGSAGHHPEHAHLGVGVQQLPHDAAFARTRRTHQRSTVFLLQPSLRCTAGCFI